MIVQRLHASNLVRTGQLVGSTPDYWSGSGLNNRTVSSGLDYMLLIHQGNQSKVKVVAKAKSTGLYSLGLWGILPQKMLAKYTATFSPPVTKFASSSLKV